jgi:hypothetical protein
VLAEALLELVELSIESVAARAQMQDLRDQSADRGAHEEAADVLLNRGPDDAEQDRQAPSRPL